jgi:cysteine synthase A
VRKLFAHLGVDYRSVDLDAADYQAGDWGGQVRAALIERSGMPTIPQLFVGGEFIGGCSETFAALQDQSLLQSLARAGVAVTGDTAVDPYAFLPVWLHPR